MAREEAETKKPTTDRHTRKRLWCAAVVLIIALILLGLSWISGLRESQSAEERLAAIEAKRAIPDEENAAIVYNQLLDDYDEDTFSQAFLAGKTDTLTTGGPWLSKDHPEVAQWLDEQQGTISQLLEACKKKECRLPIRIDAQAMADRMQLFRMMRRWAFLIVRAGNNDMAEGRVDAGLEKYLCLMQMGKHMRQQPVLIDYLMGMAIEAIGLGPVARFTVEGDAAETHLKVIEAALPRTKDNWSEDSSILRETERLLSKKFYGRFKRLVLFCRGTDRKRFDRIHEVYLRSLTARRGNHILVALRRHKNKTGRWPESLEQVHGLVSKEISVDPYNNGSFVYKLAGDSFRLYSRGKNNVDEEGKWEKNRADDWMVWPPR
jgi:hypothetical protein